MAKTIAGFSNTKPASLVTAVNTALAALTNPTLRGLSISVHDQQQYLGLEYSLQPLASSRCGGDAQTRSNVRM